MRCCSQTGVKNIASTNPLFSLCFWNLFPPTAERKRPWNLIRYIWFGPRRPDRNKSPTEWRGCDLWRQMALTWQALQDMGGPWSKTRMLAIYCQHIQFWELCNGGSTFQLFCLFFCFVFFCTLKKEITNMLSCPKINPNQIHCVA